MVIVDKALQAKAKRRIKRFLATGNPQARVHALLSNDEDVFEYKVKHHGLSLFFKKDKLNRLRLMNK